MSSYKPIDDRQVVNRAALPHIGSPANDSLDDIFTRIDALIGGGSSGPGYISKNVSLASGNTSETVTFTAQPDLSYVVLAMLENDVDSDPQFQQVEITAKSTTGFTASWNIPLSTSNYSLNYIILPKWVSGAEIPISASASDVAVTLPIPLNGVNYGIVGSLQNITDANPQFQTTVVTNQTSNIFIDSWNALTNDANYILSYLSNPTAQISIGSGVSSITVTLPVAYGSNGYAVIASLSNVTDPSPKFQPLLITAKSSSQFTISFNTATPTANYLLTYYAISLTA